MRKVSLDLGEKSYFVHIGKDVHTNLGSLVKDIPAHIPIAIIGDVNVLPVYARTVEGSLAAQGARSIFTLELAPGEEQKTLDTVREIYNFLATNRFERQSVVFALGGGVIGDMVGFAAATYLRGLRFVQLPTTLLSMVDASVGGKVAVNLPQGKNLVGCFYQPQVVAADVKSLLTLPAREFRCGLAECVKHALLDETDLLSWIEHRVDAINNRDLDVLEELVYRNVLIKANIVGKDEKETGIRAWLNLGHTFAHAFEATAGYGTLGHGEAVSLGLVAASMLSVNRGLWSLEDAWRVESLLKRFSLPTRAVLESDSELISVMAHDKKVSGKKLRFVLPNSVGKVVIYDDVEEEEIKDALGHIRA